MKVGDSQVAVAAGGEEGDDEDEGEEEPVALRPADDASQALRGHATSGLSDRRRVQGHSVSFAHAASSTQWVARNTAAGRGVMLRNNASRSQTGIGRERRDASTAPQHDTIAVLLARAR